MRTQSFKTLGIDIDNSIPITELLGENFNPGIYQMTDDQTKKVNALRDIVFAYVNADDRRKRKKISNSKEAARLMNSLRHLSHEEVWMALLDNSGRVIGTQHIFTGTLNSVTLASRDIIAKALSKDAASIILYHNHPSGSPLPSSADIEQTRLLKQACKLMQIQLLDHIVISFDNYYSFSDEYTSKF